MTGVDPKSADYRGRASFALAHLLSTIAGAFLVIGVFGLWSEASGRHLEQGFILGYSLLGGLYIGAIQGSMAALAFRPLRRASAGARFIIVAGASALIASAIFTLIIWGTTGFEALPLLKLYVPLIISLAAVGAVIAQLWIRSHAARWVVIPLIAFAAIASLVELWR